MRSECDLQRSRLALMAALEVNVGSTVFIWRSRSARSGLFSLPFGSSCGQRASRGDSVSYEDTNSAIPQRSLAFTDLSADWLGLDGKETDDYRSNQTSWLRHQLRTDTKTWEVCVFTPKLNSLLEQGSASCGSRATHGSLVPPQWVLQALTKTKRKLNFTVFFTPTNKKKGCLNIYFANMWMILQIQRVQAVCWRSPSLRDSDK